MAHTFDIRFDRSAGFAALLEAPTNSFRWKGSGRLSIDAAGISIACRRGWLSWSTRNRTRRIPTANLKEISREGEALRVEFATAGSPRASLLFWARDRDTAARIASLLPTTHAVELEHATERRDKKFHSGARSWFVAGAVAVAVVIAAALAWERIRTPSPDTASVTAPPIYDVPAVDVPALPDGSAIPLNADTPLERDGAGPFIIEVPMPPLRMPILPADDIVPIPRGSAAYPIARDQLKRFETETASLWADYRVERDLLARGSLTPDKFAEHLELLEFRWWNTTFRILDERRLDQRELLDLRADLLGVARHWRSFLNGYAEGLRNGDSVRIAASFDELARAEELQSRARRRLR